VSRKTRSLFPPVPEALPVPIIDNHTHVGTDRAGQTQARDEDGTPRYPLLIDGQLAAMKQSGISRAITVGCEIPDLEDVIDLARSHPEFSAAIAIHPNETALHAGVREVAPDGLDPAVADHHTAFDLDDAIARVAELASAPEVVAIGETGLDYFRTQENGRAAQQ